MKTNFRFSVILPVGLLILLSLWLPGCSDNSLDSYTFEPKPEVDVMVLKDIDYTPNIFFDLGRLPLYRSRSDTLPEPEKYDFMPGDSIVQLLVYIDDLNPDTAIRFNRHAANVYVDPEDTLSDDPNGEYRVSAYIEQVDEALYYSNPTNYYLLFLTPFIGDDDMIAVYMEVRRAGGEIDTIGDISSSPFRLKLIRPSEYTHANHHVWEYRWKNVYWLGEYNIDLAKIDVAIYKGSPIDNETINPGDLNNQEGVRYLQIMGLDQGDNYGNPPPDGEIDRRRLSLFDHNLGLLFFLNRHPFDSRFSYVTDPATGDSAYLNDSVPEIYMDPSPDLSAASKYYIAISRR